MISQADEDLSSSLPVGVLISNGPDGLSDAGGDASGRQSAGGDNAVRLGESGEESGFVADNAIEDADDPLFEVLLYFSIKVICNVEKTRHIILLEFNSYPYPCCKIQYQLSNKSFALNCSKRHYKE